MLACAYATRQPHIVPCPRVGLTTSSSATQPRLAVGTAIILCRTDRQPNQIKANKIYQGVRLINKHLLVQLILANLVHNLFKLQPCTKRKMARRSSASQNSCLILCPTLLAH